jgi:hypothetical protein
MFPGALKDQYPNSPSVLSLFQRAKATFLGILSMTNLLDSAYPLLVIPNVCTKHCPHTLKGIEMCSISSNFPKPTFEVPDL